MYRLRISRILPLLIAVYLSGCGGGGSAGTASEFIETASTSIGTAGSLIKLPVSGIEVSFSAGSLVRETEVAMRVQRHPQSSQSSGIGTSSEHPLQLDFTPSDLQNGSQIDISIPILTTTSQSLLPWMQSPEGKLICLGAPSTSTGGQFKFSVHTTTLKKMAASSRGSSTLSIAFGFIALEGYNPAPASGSLKIYRNGRFEPIPSGMAFNGKRVAIVVHGIMNDISNMTPLGNFLATDPQLNSVGGHYKPMYDYVIGYDHDFRAPIDANGKLFADAVREKCATVATLDVFAHSQGGLISRWAVEKEGLDDIVSRVFLFGVPNEGVPQTVLITFLLNFVGPSISYWAPGISGLVEPNGAQGLPFLSRLNGGGALGSARERYYTVAGNAWWRAEYGLFMTYAYGALGLDVSNGFEHDGIVPTYSAQAFETLGRKSNFYRDNPIASRLTPLSHPEIPTNSAGGVTPAKTPESILRSWLLADLQGGVR